MATNVPRESTIEGYLVSRCRDRGWLCYKTESPGRSGFPDRTIVTNAGMVAFVEVKRPGEVPRKLQVHTLKRLREHRANVCVVHDRASVDTLVSALRCGRMPAVAPDNTFYVIDA